MFLQGLLFAVVKTDRCRRHNGRNGVFVDKLRLAIAAQQHTEVVKPRDDPLELHTVDEKNRDGNFCFANIVQKCILQVLLIGGHIYLPFFLRFCCELPL
jgi:hypothetical protein